MVVVRDKIKKLTIREHSVPCKLNNVRQTITPWTIKMDCLSVLERITANENS